jgi:cytochrome c
MRHARKLDFSDLVLREDLSGRLNRYAADWRNGHCGLREYVPYQHGVSRMRSLVLVLGAGIFAIVPGYAQDAASGEKIFVQCKACHQIGESAKNAVGPVLNGLFGRKAGMIEGYSYSAANKNSGITWDEATFREYIKDPKAKIPGTKMAFPGLKDPKQIDDVVAYLKQFDSTGKKAEIVPAGTKLAKAP